MKDTIKKALFLGVGAASLTKQQLEIRLKPIAKKANMNSKEAKEVIKKIAGAVSKEEKRFAGFVKKETTKAHSQAKKKYDPKINQLKKKVLSLEKRLQKKGRSVAKNALKKANQRL